MSLSKPIHPGSPLSPPVGSTSGGADSDKQKRIGWAAAIFTRAGFLRGFLTGYIAKALMTLLPKFVRAKGNLRRLWPAIAQNLGPRGDPVLYGLFFGGMNTVFYRFLKWAEGLDVPLEPRNATESALQFIQTHRVAIAGLVSGLCLLLVPSGDRTSVSLFLFTHALEVLVRYAAQRRWLPRFCHADVLLMIVASMQVIWAWFHSRPSHDPSYLNFLDSFGDHPYPIMKGYQAILDVHDKSLWPSHPDLIALNGWRAARNIHPLKLDLPNQQHVCDLLHPQTMSCLEESKRFLLKCFGRSSKIYLGRMKARASLCPLFPF